MASALRQSLETLEPGARAGRERHAVARGQTGRGVAYPSVSSSAKADDPVTTDLVIPPNVLRLLDARFWRALAERNSSRNANRAWKIRLIEENNPNWDDLFLGIAAP